MVRISCILLAGCLGALGQAFTLQDTAFLGNAIPTVSSAPLSPTNLPNASSISWWKAADYVTNGGVMTQIPDSGPGGYTLTNLQNTYEWMTYGGTLNGITLVSNMYGHSYLQSQNYTSAQPHTVCMVVKLLEFEINTYILFDSANATYRNSFSDIGASDPKRFSQAAGDACDWYLRTNTWMLLEVLYNGANSQVWTNSTAVGAAQNTGTDNCSGFTLCSTYLHPGNGPDCLIGEVMTYSTAFTASDRSALYSYVKSKYGAGNFP